MQGRWPVARTRDASGDAAPALRVLLADDHPVVRAGVATMLAGAADLQVVGEAADGAEALRRFRELVPDVLVIDLRMPVMDGVAAIRAIRAEYPAARALALTTFDGDADIHRALEAGASGYLLKDSGPAALCAAVRRVGRGERVIPGVVASRLAEHLPRRDLTPREEEVLLLVARGLDNAEIAQAIGRTDETVKAHLKGIFLKLGVERRTEAVAVGLARGIIHLD